MPRLAPRLLLLALLAASAMIFAHIVFRAPPSSRLDSPAERDDRLLPDDPPAPVIPATPDYSLIEPGLYVGGFVDPPPPAARAVLCLSQIKDDYTAPVYQWSPIPDAAPAPSLDWLRDQVAFIDAQRRAGNTVFVHCDAGISRGPMVAAAYLMWKYHWPRDHALDALRAARPAISPNPAFLDLLQSWQQSLAVPPPPPSATDHHRP